MLMRWIVGVLLSLGTAACSTGSNDAVNDPLDSGLGGRGGSDGVAGTGSGVGDSSAAASEFFDLLNFTNTSGPELSGEVLIEKAVAIVQGSFVGVEDGRTIDFAEGASHPIHMAVFKFSTSKVLKGTAAQFAYVEHMRGGVSVESFRTVLPVQLPIILFLREASGWEAPVYAIEGDAKGRPEGATLYTYLTELGVVAEDNRGLYYPLAHSPRAPVFDPAVTTLDDLAKLIEAEPRTP